ncbi:MAG: isoprenylcysteine carboxylmethyltransferase family protein [Chloroflexota bacterium]
MTHNDLPQDKLDQPYSIWYMLILPFYIFTIFSLIIFWPAGTWDWREGWFFVITLTLNISISTAITNYVNPRVLRNRSKLKKDGLTKATQKSASSDRFILPILGISMYAAVIVAGLGPRYGWYLLPFWVSMTALVLMNLGAVLLQVATAQNSFASKILDINQDQVLVDSGLYAHIRHPLYTGGILMMVFMPLALGSLWGVPLALLAGLMIVIRIKYEEDMLLKGMPGYADYQQRVKYKLIPGLY